MANKGYIKLYRQIQDCWIWFADEKFSKAQAWVDLLMLANHKEKKLYFNGELVTIERGQNMTSIRALSERWGWSKDSVSRFLKLLENDGMIEKICDTHRTLITIINYEVFQSSETDDETQIGQEQGHQQGHGTDTNKDTGETQIGTNNKLKNDNKNVEECNKNEKNEINITPFYIPPAGEKKRVEKFVPPTLDEVIAYCNERNNNVNPETFISFYESKGWMVGKNKMKDWKASVRTWEQKEKQKKQSGGSTYIDAIKNRVSDVDNW
jgi:hypothetical protein